LSSIRAKRGIFVAPFDELADPRLLMELAARAEELGWDGFFLWDHIRYRAPTRAVLDVWVALSAIATATERVRIGPMVTPVSRRRPHKLARETVTLDHLSDGRLTLGVGLGSVNNGELAPFGEEEDAKTRAHLLDEGLGKLADYWAGEFEPMPVQQPRIPVWVAGRWPKRRPLRRAARWDGMFPIDLPGPDALGELAPEVAELRNDPDAPFDLVVEMDDPGDDPSAWEAAGATWVLTSFDQSPLERDVRAVIEAGPSG
jgi:alkanesulfonate monooxygenase SsuD/methylene tetrahydromethanopterin reductase-like flavin-dependent oxidoreductase (luciferase family)